MHISVFATYSAMVPIRYQHAKMLPTYGYSDNRSNYWCNT